MTMGGRDTVIGRGSAGVRTVQHRNPPDDSTAMIENQSRAVEETGPQNIRGMQDLSIKAEANVSKTRGLPRKTLLRSLLVAKAKDHSHLKLQLLAKTI